MAVCVQLGCVGVPGGIDSGVFITVDSGTPAGRDAGAQGPLDAGTTSVVDAGKTADAGRGTRFDGGVISPRLAGLADNTGLDLGKFTCTDPDGSDNCARVTDYSGLVYDSNAHQLLMFGGGHATTMTDTVFAFDLTTSLAWRELYLPTPCAKMISSNLDTPTGAWKSGTSGPYPRPLAAHTYDLLAFAPVQNEFVMISRLFNGGYCSTVGNDVGGPVAHFDLDAQTWSFTTAHPVGGSTIDASELDPVSGKVLIFGGQGLGFYDLTTRLFTLNVDALNGGTLKTSQGGTADLSALGYANDLVYFPPTDTFYYFARGSPVVTYALKLNRANLTASTLDRVTTTGPTSDHQNPGYSYDSLNQIIGGGIENDHIFIFEPPTNTWASHAINGGSPGTQAFLAIGYDPVNNVFVFVNDYASGQHTWAYRYKN